MLRHQAILDLLEKENYVSVQDLCSLFEVSAVTIRKDLKLLEQKGLLYKTHGGASYQNPYIGDKHVNEKEKLKVNEKESIAAEAAKMIQPNDSIMIASGTTMQALARAINIESKLNITSSSLSVSLELSKSPYYTILQLGGNVRHNSFSVSGHFSQELLKNISCNLLFLGVDGIDIEHGCSTTSLEEAILNQQMIQAAQKVVVLADSTKFDKKGFGKICELSAIDHIITDNQLSGKTEKKIREMGVKLSLVAC